MGKRFDTQAMDEARDDAVSEFRRLLANLEPAEREGARLVAEWLAAWYRLAGYKRLCRFLIFESGLAVGGSDD